MAGKKFSDNNVFDEWSQTYEAPEDDTKATPEDNVPDSLDNPAAATPKKRGVGRPKTKDVKNSCRHINVAIPNEILDKWDEIKQARGGNLTAYITDLIKADLDKNYDKYKQIIDLINNN